MKLGEIQREVELLDPAEQRELTHWLADRYAPRQSVAALVRRAQSSLKAGEWRLTPPESENIPAGEELTRAVTRFQTLSLPAQ